MVGKVAPASQEGALRRLAASGGGGHRGWPRSEHLQVYGELNLRWSGVWLGDQIIRF